MATETILLELEVDDNKLKLRATENAKAIRDLSDKLRVLKIVGKELAPEFQKQSSALRLLKKEQRETVKQIDLNTTANKAQTGSNQQLKAQLSILTIEYNKLSKSERINTKRGQQLRTTIRGLSDQLKKNESVIGDNRREVGNYGKALGGLRKSFLNVVRAAGLTFGAIGALRVITDVTKVFKNFEKQNAVLAGVLNKSREEISPLTDEAKRLGSETAKTASEVTQLQIAFARLGFSELNSRLRQTILAQALEL